MEELTAELRIGDPVDGVADDGELDRLQVNADLVRAPGLEAHRQQCVRGKELQHLEVRDRLTGCVRVE